MNPLKLIILLFLFVGVSYCAAKVEGTSENNSISHAEKTSNVSATAIAEKSPYAPAFQTAVGPGDFSWRSGVGQALIIGGAAVFSLFVIGGLSLFVAPALGFRICSVLGNCDEPTMVTAYSSGASTLQNPAQPNSATYADFYNTYLPATGYAGYQKRSLDYVGPILKTLASAYEKYEKHVAKQE